MIKKNKIVVSFFVLSLIAISPQAFAAEFVIDDFSDGAATVSVATNVCDFSNEVTIFLGGVRNIFACRDSGAGTVTSETDTILEQFIFTLNQAQGSSGLNYDNNGNLLGGVDVADGGTNNAFRLDFVKADYMTAVTVAVADGDGKVGTFEFQFGPSGPATEFIPFAMIKDPVTMEVPDFSNLDYVGILLEGQEPNNQDTELILGKVSTDSAVEPPPDNGRMAVGGELIPLDSTMVLVAGTQSIAAWMIPILVSAIGIGIVLARKF